MLMKRVLAVLFTILLSGCLTYDSYGYRNDGYYEDRYYSGGRSHYDGYYSGYGSDYAYWNDYPAYVYGSAYYSVLWPVYRGYYDPFYTPGFYYGVTWYPRTYFGLGHSWYSWPYYHAYSPYRYSYSDGYYDHWDRRRGQVSDRVSRGQSASVSHPYSYGSARNEAERLAYQSGVGRKQQGSEQPGLHYDPFAARRSDRLSQSRARGQMPARDQGGTGRGELPARAPLQRNQEPYRTRIDRPVRSTEPARSRTPDRAADQLRSRDSGWVSTAPGSTPEPTGEVRLQRSRPAPYYREVAGSQVPMTRQQTLAEPRGVDQPIERSRSREMIDYQPIRQAPVYRSERSVHSDPMAAPPATQSYDRSSMPARQAYEARPAPQFEAAPSRGSYSAPPSRSMDQPASRPERSETRSSGSAREEARRSRDED